MATLEALQDKTDQAEGNRVAMESRLLEEFGKNERALQAQGLKVEGLKLLMEKHRQLADSKLDRDKKIITTFLDSIQDQLITAGKWQNDILNGVNDIKNILRKKATTRAKEKSKGIEFT